MSCAGHQPLHSVDESDDIHIVVNGELYYEPTLRAQLEKEYSFQSTSDSEMVIPLYKRYGSGFVDYLRGEFSLVVYDGKTQTLIAARDRFGVKPLHYGIFDGKLLIATQCKGVVGLMDRKQDLAWDVHGLAQGGGHYGNRSLFKGIRRVPQGNMTVYRQGQAEPLEFKPYYQAKYPANKGGHDDRSADQLTIEARNLLLEAVRIRLDSADVPVGILLSGGVDSSTVAGIASHLARQRLEKTGGKAPPLPTCFTIAFPNDSELDESSIAARTAEHLGLPLEKVVVSEQNLADEFEESCWKGEALMWDLQHVAKKALARHISSRGFKVVLNGDGGDEVFGGYPFFAADRLLEDDRQRAKHLLNASDEDFKILKQEYYEKAAWYGAETVGDQRHLSKYAQALSLPASFCNLAISTHDEWLKDEVRRLNDPFQAMHESFDGKEVEEMATYHPVRRGMLAWNRTILPNAVIAAVSDGAEMAHGVESRPPLLDHVLAEFASTLPVDLLVHLDGRKAPVEKWLFRQAAAPYLTQEVYERRKYAFAAPFKWKIGGPLHQKLCSLINRKNLLHLGFVDCDRAEDILRRSFDEQDQLLFRKTLWLAQIVSMGMQFGVRTWTPSELDVV